MRSKSRAHKGKGLTILLSSGADIIGVNCKFDPTTSMEALRLMKEALDKEGLHPHLMIQPVGYHTPDAGRTGFQSLPELPFGETSLHSSLVACNARSDWLVGLVLKTHALIGCPDLPQNTASTHFS